MVKSNGADWITGTFDEAIISLMQSKCKLSGIELIFGVKGLKAQQNMCYWKNWKW
jgi:hypothetical protein